MTSKELRKYLKAKCNIYGSKVFVNNWKTVAGKRTSYTVEIPAYKVIDWLQAGYELGREEAQAKSQRNKTMG